MTEKKPLVPQLRRVHLVEPAVSDDSPHPDNHGTRGGAAGAFSIYIMIYHKCGGDTAAGAVLYGTWFTVYQVATLTVIPFVAWAAKKLGEVPALASFLTLGLSSA